MAKPCKLIVLSGGKGGVGRSTMARNFLVASATAGFKTIGFDLDRQATLHKWHLRRQKSREKLPECVATDVRIANVADWRSLVEASKGFEVAVVDTAPGIEENMAAMVSLCRAATFVAIPCGVTHDDIESVVPWMRTLMEQRVKAAFILNKANRRTKSFAVARNTLLRNGPVAPVEVPLLEDIHAPSSEGLCTLDYENARGSVPIEGVWMHIRREIGL